jgi:Zn-finger nucleic acid-binding protein
VTKHRNCPRCQANRWAPVDAQGQLQRCEACLGTWLAANAAERLLRNKVDVDPALLSELASHFSGTRLTCPHCSEKMSPLTLRGQQVDVCLSCQNMWLDHGELSRLTQGSFEEPSRPGASLGLELGLPPDPKPPAGPEHGPTEDKNQESISSQGPYPKTAQVTFQNPFEDDRMEAWVRAVAIPASLFLAFLMSISDGLRNLGKIFLSMWIHELGHATTAWFTAYPAFPGPWKTWVFEEQSVLMFLLVTTALFAWGFVSFSKQRWFSVGAAACLLILQIVGSVILPEKTAKMLITFGGDGGGMILGAILIGTIYVGRDHRFHHGWLRFGFLWIGSVSLMNASQTWWAAKKDFAAIPFGRQEGVGLSDASKLVDWYGWTETDMITRHNTLSLFCFVWIAALYGFNLWKMRNHLRRKP